MTHAQRAHARFAPSAAHRWVNCRASVGFTAGMRNKSTPAADEGTAAHMIADTCLNKGWDVADHYHVDNAIQVRKGVEIRVTEEMIEGVQVYLDHVREVFDQCDEFAIEARLDMSHLHPEFFGTGDALGFDESTETLHVMDFKFGRKAVDPVENWQAVSYAIGAMRKYEGRRISKVLVHIIQPRVNRGPVTWEVDLNVLAPHIQRIRDAIKEAETPGAAFNPGDWCDYCPGAAACKALRERSLEIARDEFGELHDETGLSPDALGKMLSELDVLEAWAKRVRAYALEQAMEGHAPAGHKLVMKRAVRKWRDDSAAATALREVFDMADDEVFVKKMRSPAQVEKLLDKTSRKAMADLVTKTSSGVTLAPESDKREAISPDAAAEFSTVEIEE
jgi:hypothetical protein